MEYSKLDFRVRNIFTCYLYNLSFVNCLVGIFQFFQIVQETRKNLIDIKERKKVIKHYQ